MTSWGRKDTRGRTIIHLTVDDWTLEKLMTFDADAAELEDEGDGEPDDKAEAESPPVPLDLKRAKVVRRRLDTLSSAGQRAG